AFKAFSRRRSGTGLGSSHKCHYLMNNPIFTGRNALFVCELGMEAHIELFTAGDTILTQGDIADRVFCLKTGEVEVIVDDVPITSLAGDGTIFGLAAMFKCVGGSNKRNATVKALGLCDCRVITQAAFHAALKRYPEEKAHFQKLAEEQVKVTLANQAVATAPKPGAAQRIRASL
ncbi:unnamed protein product, partial [Polarella glacialis]